MDISLLHRGGGDGVVESDEETMAELDRFRFRDIFGMYCIYYCCSGLNEYYRD